MNLAVSHLLLKPVPAVTRRRDLGQPTDLSSSPFSLARLLTVPRSGDVPMSANYPVQGSPDIRSTK